ncbi:MAG: response regulator transcription factor [Dehalococcoidales bacterium]|nr:response regulator transcription factor [Dehalococcoidales bacterium]
MKQKVDQVRIFITDSEAVYRKGIGWALSEIDDFEVIGEATTNIETLEKLFKTPTDLLILNTNHSKPSGIDVTRYISHKLPDVKVILMMDEYRTEYVVGALKSGAKACFGKSIHLDSLIQTINRVIHDELPISHFLLRPDVADFIIKEYEVSNKLTEETDRAHIRLVKSEQMILDKISENIPLADLISSLGISREILVEYLDEIVEKLVKTEYFNETPEQRYISHIISRNIGETPGEQYEKSGDQSYDFHTEGIEPSIPENSPPDIGLRLNREEKEIYQQSTGINEPVKDISEIIELARKAGRLSSIHVFNQHIMAITEGLMTEIDRRRRILRRIKKAIEFELEFAKDSDITRN